uniref:Phosphoglycerate mutase n=1 Tax=Solanum tuberosum TaxID=4113 RepID=M0ZJF5_SOLTU
MADSTSRVISQPECGGDAKSENVSPSFTEIIVIRHGETEWNADGRIQGHLDVELNDIGRQQATAVAARLSKEPRISVIYSSDLKRAHETAEIIARSCGDLEVIKDPDLRERHLGDLQGISLREAAKSQPLAYKAFLSDRNDQVIPVSTPFSYPNPKRQRKKEVEEHPMYHYCHDQHYPTFFE